MEFNSSSILNLSIGQVVLSRGILIVVWVKPSAWKPSLPINSPATKICQQHFTSICPGRTRRFRKNSRRFRNLFVSVLSLQNVEVPQNFAEVPWSVVDRYSFRSEGVFIPLFVPTVFLASLLHPDRHHCFSLTQALTLTNLNSKSNPSIQVWVIPCEKEQIQSPLVFLCTWWNPSFLGGFFTLRFRILDG